MIPTPQSKSKLARQQWAVFVARSQSDESHELSRYQGNPIAFMEDFLGERLTDEQKKIVLSVRDDRETNVQAAHGVGKSHLCSRLCLYFIYCEGGMVITTAPTARQVNQIIWGEIRRVHGKLGLPGELGKTFLRLNENARGFGFTASSSNGFQGIHKDKLLVIEDEACGISSEIDEGASSCATGANNRLLRVGNPIETGGPFEKACKQSHIRVPVWSHPNVAWAYQQDADGVHRLKPEVAAAILNAKGEVKPQSEWPDWCQRDVIAGAVSITWIEEARAKYGEGSAYWQSRVEGLFPEDAAQSVIPRSYFWAARRRYDANPAYWDEQANAQPSRFGLDVGDGVDDHARSRWRGSVLYSVKSVATKGDMKDSSRATGLAVEGLKDHPGAITVDRSGGFGSGPLDALLEQGYNAVGVHWGQAAENAAEFLNAKAEDFWVLREAMRKEEVAIAPLGEYEDRAMEDLAGVYYENTATGKIKMEDKEKTRKRLHRSPDIGDAIIIGFRNPVTANWIGEW